MAHVQYSSIRGVYTRRPCTVDDIEEDLIHVKKSLATIGEPLKQEEEYIHNMTMAIYHDMAFTVEREGVKVGFLYLREDSKFKYKVVASALGCDDVLSFVILMLTAKMHKYAYLVLFPHGSSFRYLKSLLVGSSLREYHEGVSKHVVLKKDTSINSKFIRLVKYFKIHKIKG